MSIILLAILFGVTVIYGNLQAEIHRAIDELEEGKIEAAHDRLAAAVGR